MSRVSRPLPEIEICCWPACRREVYEASDAPPFCGKHLIQCATYVADTMRDLIDPLHQSSPVAPVHSIPVDSDSVVYYARMGDRVKIGTTTKLAGRLRGLCVEPDALLATEPGGEALERHRHAQFASERVYSNRELFNPSPRLLAHIDALNAA